MKRYNNLYEKIVEYPNIELAHINAQKGKKHYTSVKKINKDQDRYLKELQTMLVNKTFKNSEYDTFIKRGKKDRLIYRLPYFPDRVVQHAIMNIVEPIWKKTLIRDTYSAIKKRGIHDGVKRVQGFLKDTENTQYCLKMDIKKFYPTINNDILKQIIRKKIKCKNTIWLLDEIIDSSAGVPIGNYMSQYFGNLYLDPLDHWLKEDKRIKYYARYCDDFIVLHKDKGFLYKLKQEIFSFVENELDLIAKENHQIFPVKSRGIDFLGYVFYHDQTRVRKDIVLTFKKKVRKIRQNWKCMQYTQIVNTIMSYWGWLKHADAFNLWKKYIDDEIKMIMQIVCNDQKINNPLKEI